MTKKQTEAVREVQVVFLMTILKRYLNGETRHLFCWDVAVSEATKLAESLGLKPLPWGRQSGTNLLNGKVTVPWPPGINKPSEKNGKQAARALVKYL